MPPDRHFTGVSGENGGFAGGDLGVGGGGESFFLGFLVFGALFCV